MLVESGHGENSYARRDKEAKDPRQRQRPQPAAPRLVRSASRGLTIRIPAICIPAIRIPGRRHTTGRSRPAPRGGGLGNACEGYGQDFPARCLRRGVGRRGPCRRLERRAGSERHSSSSRGWRGILGERADDRFGQPARSRLEVTHVGEQAIGGGPLPRILGQAAFHHLRQRWRRHGLRAAPRRSPGGWPPRRSARGARLPARRHAPAPAGSA